MFIPTTKEEIEKLGWDKLEIILITGDSYIDSPFCGVAVIGKILLEAGYKVGIIAQPDSETGDILRLGEPALFWGVTGGCIDSMVANYTATKKKRKSDDYTPGGINDKRPDRAVLAYTNLIRRNFKNTVPIVLGGLEASLRRIAHYDFWSNKIRRSILFDAKADYLLYGMADKSIVNFANSLKEGGSTTRDIRGLCYISKNMPEDAIFLPSFKEVSEDKKAFTEMFHTFYNNNDPIIGKTLCQQYDNRFLIQNPPEFYMTTKELDDLYALDFENEQHPFYEKQGKVKALETIRFSITTHRGCYGECNFCSIAVHQGQTVRWRSKKSILAEAERMTRHPKFKGIIQDVGGPTANMYGYECIKKPTKGPCTHRRCIFPAICKMMKPDHQQQTDILCELRNIPGIKKIFVASGIRYDLIEADIKSGDKYLKELVGHHVSGQMKVAPEHSEQKVLKKMGKPGTESLVRFREKFNKLSSKADKKQFLTYYMIAAHPGCSDNDMRELKKFTSKELKIKPEQVQIFTPTPSTYSTLMYWTETDPFTGEPVFVEKDNNRKNRQKQTLV